MKSSKDADGAAKSLSHEKHPRSIAATDAPDSLIRSEKDNKKLRRSRLSM